MCSVAGGSADSASGAGAAEGSCRAVGACAGGAGARLALGGSGGAESDVVLEESSAVLESGDLPRVGEAGGSGCADVPRVVSHARSADGLVFVVARKDDCGLGREVVEFFSGEDWVGVAARTVEGERPRGDSARRKGDDRFELNDSGAGRSGEGGFDWYSEHGSSSWWMAQTIESRCVCVQSTEPGFNQAKWW